MTNDHDKIDTPTLLAAKADAQTLVYKLESAGVPPEEIATALMYSAVDCMIAAGPQFDWPRQLQKIIDAFLAEYGPGPKGAN